ncbi:HNH endonuclease [Arthrobacter sp. D1-29]
MEKTAATEVIEAIKTSVTALNRIVRGRELEGGTVTDPMRQEADDWLDILAEAAQLQAKTAALTVRAAAGFTDTTRAMAPPVASLPERMAIEMSIVAEVACVLTISERAAGALLAESHALTRALPLTLQALQAGSISWQHARCMVDETGALDPAGAAALETHFLDPDTANAARACLAGDLTPSRFRARARTWRERHHPVSIETRHANCVLDRRVEYTPDRDGMAWLSAYLPADQAAGIWEHTTTTARALQGPTEPRTLTQLRADTLANALLCREISNPGSDRAGGTSGALLDSGTNSGTLIGAGSTSGQTTSWRSSSGGINGGGSASEGINGGGIKGANSLGDGGDGGEGGTAGQVRPPRAQVLVTVPVFSLLGLTDEPATLDGHGPIPASMARNLVTNGAHSFHRVLTDPRDGAPLEIGRTSYRLTTAMRRWLRLRDAKCPFPGCNNHSLDNEADHLLAWANGGTTGINNLGQPCRKHHHLKHNTTWQPTPASKNEPPGWTSPTGRHYKSEHQDWEPPTWPDHVLNELQDTAFTLEREPEADHDSHPWHLVPSGGSETHELGLQHQKSKT